MVRNSLHEMEKWIPSTCDLCSSNCGIRVKIVNGIAVKIEGDPNHPHNRGKLCAKGNSGLNYLYNPNRLKVPLKRTNPQKGIGIDPGWTEIGWDEALNIAAEKIRKAREKDPRLILVTTYDRTHEFGIIGPIVHAIGTPNFLVGGAGFTCGNSYHPVSYLNHGTWYFEPDLEYCHFLLMFGSQTGFISGYSAMPTAMEMAHARTKGIKIVVFDPICNTAGSKADEWIPIRPGTDGAVAIGLLSVILHKLKRYDEVFLRRFTNAPYLVMSDGTYARDPITNKPLVWDIKDAKPKTYDKCTYENVALEGVFPTESSDAVPSFALVKKQIGKFDLDHISRITTVSTKTIHRIAEEYCDAASLGDTITIDNKTLPFRPVASVFERGTSGHRHGFLSSWAIQLLNTFVGNLDTPGGMLGLNSCGPWWSPKMSADGLLIPSEVSAAYYTPYPARKAGRPNGLELMELFPVACFAQTSIPLATIDGTKFGLDYVPEVMIHCRSNYIHTTGDPLVMQEFAKKIPFILSFESKMDESADFSDIILPECVYLERAPMLINTTFVGTKVGLSSWYWGFIQPVVDPPEGVRDWTLVLMEIIKRAGFLEDLYKVINEKMLKEPYKLDLGKYYHWDEIVDRWAKSWAGEDKGIDYLRRTGFVEFSGKKVEEVYWRHFGKIRSPIYLEHLVDAGKNIEAISKEMDLEWDISDYQPVPDWKPCPAYVESPEYDMYVVNYKTIQNSLSHTVESNFIDQINLRKREYDVVMNSGTALSKGIRDGDDILIETTSGKKCFGTVKLVETIHPECVGIAGGFGHWSAGMKNAKGKGVHWNSLLQYDWDHIDHIDGALDMCIKARVSRYHL